MRVNLYAAPWVIWPDASSDPSAVDPTTAVSPSSASDRPNMSLGWPSPAVSRARSLHVSPEGSYTYTAPWSYSCPTAATMMVSAEIATLPPNAIPMSASLGRSIARRVHVAPDRVKTKADPALTPATVSSMSAPTTSRSP